MRVRIYQKSKSAMQSGSMSGRSGLPWHIEVVRQHPAEAEPLMGWQSSMETLHTIDLAFPRLEDAVAYAEKHGFEYIVSNPTPKRRRAQAYADNFRFGRKQGWTH